MFVLEFRTHPNICVIYRQNICSVVSFHKTAIKTPKLLNFIHIWSWNWIEIQSIFPTFHQHYWESEIKRNIILEAECKCVVVVFIFYFFFNWKCSVCQNCLVLQCCHHWECLTCFCAVLCEMNLEKSVMPPGRPQLSRLIAYLLGLIWFTLHYGESINDVQI